MKNPSNLLITGASSGIGAALALYYAAPGKKLYLGGRNEARLADIAEKCRQAGAKVEILLLDVTDRDGMRERLQAIDEAYPLDLVIANAGISGGSGGHSVFGEDDDQLRRIMSVNLDGVFNTVTPLLERMAKRGRGQIALMSSLAGMHGLPSAPAYSTSKVAVKAYGESLRGWLGRHGVQVNVVMPGYVRTPLTSKNPFPMPFIMSPEKAARIIATGLARNKGRIAFPFAVYAPMWVLSFLMPNVLSEPIFARMPDKPSLPVADDQ